MGELISVIVPVYNSERFLNQCIESILEQTYRDLEIILINDGSTDRSLEIMEEYAKQERRIIRSDRRRMHCLTAVSMRVIKRMAHSVKMLTGRNRRSGGWLNDI